VKFRFTEWIAYDVPRENLRHFSNHRFVAESGNLEGEDGN
jgi:hypothetical protein